MPSSISNWKVFIASTLTIFIIGLIALYLIKVNLQTVKLPPPNQIPQYSVYYLYNFQISPMVSTYYELAVEKDMQKIKDGGFSGIKLAFYYNEDNTISTYIARKAAKRGLYPIGILVGHNKKPKDRAFTSEEFEKWLTFVRNVARENRQLIYFWEVWNEPDTEKYRYGTIDEYIDLLSKSGDIIKTENSVAKVIFAIGAVDENGVNFINTLLEKGGGDYFDILGFHPYAVKPFVQKDVFNISIEKIKEINKKNENRWSLWITEIGQPTESSENEEQQAELGSYVFEKAKEENIPIIWFYFSDERIIVNQHYGGYGLIRKDGSERPIFEKIRKVIKN